MFYQTLSERIDTPNTYLDPRLVFTGNYWDEFGLTSFFIPDHARVLMLGVGLGGGIRSLLSSTKAIQLDAVDLDARSIDHCKEIYKKKFPHLVFNSICADAETFIQNKKSEYDFIWIDLYQSDSYCDLNFDPEFMNSIKKALKIDGVIAVNAYGVPTQFSPLACGSAQSAVAATLKAVFTWVGAIPNRRNQTLFASQKKPHFYGASAHPDLIALDKKSFQVQSIRSQAMTEVTGFLLTTPYDFTANFSAQDEIMRDGWKKVLNRLKNFGVELSKPQDLLDLIQDEESVTHLLKQTLLCKDTLILKTIAILCSGESFLRDLDIDWFFRWTLENELSLQQVLAKDYLNVWLTQSWALVLNPHKKYRIYSFQISDLIERAL